MKRDELDARLLPVLEIIEACVKFNGYPPTAREIQSLLGLPSTGTVLLRLKRLQELGFITRNPRTARSIVILEHD